MSRRVAFLVTHLTGTGHLVRTLALARAVAAAGGAPVVLSGGRPLPHLDAGGVEVVQLPPVAVRDLDYATLRTPEGAPADDALRAARLVAIRGALARLRPEVLVCELWPFGRRLLGAEFAAALAAMPAGARTAVSIRDILEPPRKPRRVAETVAALARVDAVLVHGDPDVTPLSLSWPGDGTDPPPEVAAKLRHTGFVVAPPPTPGAWTGEVLVAVGGGALGRRLLAVAAEAARGSARPWRLRVGGADAAAEAARLSALGPAIAEPAAADHRARLAGAAVSVSLAGYNSAVEAALAETPAILVPMTEGGEREQALRARAFAALPGIMVLDPEGLTPEALCTAVEAAAAAPRIAAPLAADGAARSAEILLGL